MKNMFLSLRRKAGISGVIMLTLALGIGCKKTPVEENTKPVAGLMSFNLAPDKSGVRISVSGDVINSQGLNYEQYSTIYQEVEPGHHIIESASGGAMMASAGFHFEEDNFYSLFVLGNQGTYSNIIVRDKYENLSDASGKTFLRYVNAIPDSSDLTVTIAATGANISVPGIHYAHVSDFVSLNNGLDVVVRISNGNDVETEGIFNFVNGRVYTVVFTGIPGTGDESKSVKIHSVMTGAFSGN
ncbi:MAG TPA: DUF4397 domain-containing protein [Flavitalea sp.]|nr:DUF4397 domain-containing protein [Flavitalea sp.]